ncbi:MAG: DNA mismatch repair protein MutS, partial [Angelakisella sp.]
MNTTTTLEYHKILAQLSQLALSERAQQRLLALSPTMSERECRKRMSETTEALRIFEAVGTPPLATMKELDKILELCEKGSMLLPEQLGDIALFITGCNRMRSYLKKAETTGTGLSSYGGAFCDLSTLLAEIERSIKGSMVDDRASPTLRDIRRKTETVHLSIKQKLETLLRSRKEWFSDGYIATRNGRFVLPVKKEYKNQLDGSVIDLSATGSTCFMEPASVRRLQEELSTLQLEEDNEIRRILYTLTAMVDEQMAELRINMDCMEVLDFAFAKAKLSTSMKAIPVEVTTQRRIKIVEGRHPLLPTEVCVPLNFEIGGEVRGVVITGPNTGGKTVALKTVGLLTLMAQSGLHLPVEAGSLISMQDNVLCDIGDGQSITENLSTFSAHIVNIIDILKTATGESLVLLDELGSGTDPAEGMGIAVSILEELRLRGCLFVATTHYPEIKEYAMTTPGLLNARMEFDRENLKPLYRLEIGEAGESCALYIARRLGFPEHMLRRAHTEAYRRTAGTERAVPQMEFAAEEPPSPLPATHSRIVKDVPTAPSPQVTRFQMGDSVMVHPQKLIGIVFAPADEKGEVTVQIQGKKQQINHKRIKLVTPASELYPPDYDFSIVFDTV